MKEDYLWDKSGEPDHEVQQLEEALSAFKYQARPLEIPESLQIGRRRFFVPASIAAAIALLALATGIWFAMNRRNEAPVARTPERQVAPAVTSKEKESVAVVVSPPATINTEPAVRHTNYRPKRTAPVRFEMTAEERAEGERAKEQLFIALRLASSKLNQAQKRTQGGPPAQPVRNQHKVG